MPVFDFSNTTEEKKACECTYTTFQSNENTASAKYPILVLDNTAKQWKYHSCGVFMNQTKRTAFEFTQEDGTVCADILRVDARFVNLLRWLGENHINVRLSGENTPDGYAVYKIREIAFGGGKKLSAEDGFLQFMMERLFASSAPSEEAVDEEQEEDGDDMKLTSIQSITDFMTCAGRTMPDNIRLWARRNLAVARSNEVSPEERRHAQRALSIMMNIQWKNNYFEAIDPKEARRILDEELYGMERVKQRIIETIIQINRTHTLPAYGITTTFVDVFNLDEVEAAIQDNTKALYIETPSNPTMQVTDLAEMSRLATKHGLLLIVDNTFLSPYLQNPIAQGADLVVHSGTKFLGGHNDTLAGFLCTPIKALAEQIRYLFKTIGSGLSPFDSFLVLRGIKTLSVRVERQQENAMKIADWLKEQKKVTDVYYVGLPEHPGYEINQKQSRGAGSMISFRTDTEETARKVLERVKLISYAESLGGVESLITYPMLQTHGDVPVEIRERLGITETFLRLSVGIENVDDLIADLEQALA